MKSIQSKIFLSSVAGFFVLGGFLLVALHASWMYIIITVILILLYSLGLFLIIRRYSKLIELVTGGVKIIESGNLEYRIGLQRQDVFGQLSASIDNLATMLSVHEKQIQNLEMDNEVFVDQIRETHSIQERFQRLLENPNYGIFLCDFNGMISDVNATGCKLLGYSKDELLEMSFYDLYAPDELTRSINATKIGAQEQAIRFESKFQNKDKTLMDVEISSNIYDYQNEIIQNIVSDISQRKKVELELKQSEEKFRSFMESANDLMFITDASEIIIYANPAMIHALGMPLEELQTKRLSDLAEPESEGTESENGADTSGETVKDLVWKSKSGNKIYGELVTSVVLNDRDENIGLRGIFRDTTERKKIAESRRLAQLGKLVADVAHEVKNRLMAIMGIVEFVHLEYGNDKEIANDMMMIHEECRTMDDFVRQMLNFSRPSEGEYVESDIHKVLDTVLNLIAKSLKRDHIEVKKLYGKDIPKVKVNEKKMSEVFMNIIQNAQEAMDEKNTIEIRTFLKDEHVCIDITDHGAGIPEEILEQIFDPFFTTKETGTGLGVSACYGIVHAHGGELKYTSEVGKGTTAHIAIPIYSKEETDPPAESS